MIPARLYPGYISIYGATSTTGIVPKQTGLQFGVISQIYSDTPNTVSVDQSVMFKYDDDTITVDYNGTTYFLIEEQKIVLIENILS